MAYGSAFQMLLNAAVYCLLTLAPQCSTFVYIVNVYMSLNSTDLVKCVAPSTLLFKDHLCNWITFFICALWDASSIVMLLAVSRLKLWGCCAARLDMSR